MILHTFTDIAFPYLRSSDTASRAIIVIEDSGHKDLPVIKNKKFLGIVSLDQLYNIMSDEIVVEQIVDPATQKLTIKENSHPFHALHLMKQHNTNFLSVVDEKNEFLGVLTLDKLLAFLGSNHYRSHDYGIIVLEVGARNYSLSEISKIVEINNAHIVHALVNQEESSELLDVHLKINKSDLKEIIMTFERYEYHVKAVYHESEYDVDFKEKVNAFLDYLNI